MKLKNNKSVFLRTVLLFLLISVSPGAGAQEISEDLGRFSEVRTYNGIEVVIIPSEEDRISITGHSKEKVKYRIVEDRLEIRLTLDNIWSSDNTLIRVYGRKIGKIDARQGSTVKVSGELRGENLMFRVQEGASISAGIVAEKTNSKVVTAGRIELSGTSISQEIDINTGGQFYGRDLRTDETEVYVGTGGKAEVYATDYCKATAKFGGTVEIYGNPDSVDHKTSLGGKILELN